MAAKVYFVLCASAVLVQAITAQCMGNAANIGVSNIGIVGNGLPSINLGWGNRLNLDTTGLNIGASGLNYGSALSLGSPVNGGGFTVASSSPLSPSTVSIVSENQFEGPINVYGALPFLAAVALEGQMQSGGGAGIQYSCGNGNIGIVSENVDTPANYGGISGLGTGIGYGSPLVGSGTSLAGCGVAAPSLAGCGVAAPVLAAPVAPIGACGCGMGY